MVAGPLFDGVDDLRLRVPDVESGLRFYRDALGHELRWRTANTAGLGMPNSDAELVVVAGDAPTGLDLRVASVPEAIERFVEAGGTVIGGPFEIPVGRVAVLRDPWGNVLPVIDLSKGRYVTDDEGRVTGIE